MIVFGKEKELLVEAGDQRLNKGIIYHVLQGKQQLIGSVGNVQFSVIFLSIKINIIVFCTSFSNVVHF